MVVEESKTQGPRKVDVGQIMKHTALRELLLLELRANNVLDRVHAIMAKQ